MRVQATSFGLPRHASAESDDSFAVKAWDETVVAVLADGAGGARCGREASRRAVETLISNYETRPLSWMPQRALTEFVSLINRMLYQDSHVRHEASELVSTLCVVAVEGNRLFGLNVGDSRIYLLRDNQLARLSEDHVHAGMEHVLSRAIGLSADVEPHVFESDIQDGDLVFLCSDGVSRILADSELASRLAHRPSARTIVQHALELARQEAPDDMSAIVLDIAEIGHLHAAAQKPLPILETLSKGTVIDGYELVRPFQNSDRVWLATKDGQRWTLKFAPVEASGSEIVLHQFVKEAWNATRVRSEHFVKALTPEQPSARYYVMEFIEAPSLKTLLRSRPLAVDEAVELGKFLLEAEAHLLGLGLVHGDIKPENILVLNEYDRLRFKLVDLGSAAELFSVTSRAGTASYLAPERFHNSPICERTEMFALGVTLYHALTGAFPYGEIERFQTPAFGIAKSTARLNPNVPPWLDAVIQRAIAIAPERRYRHYSEFAFELANPDKVEPFFASGASLLERNPLLFYKTGFWVLLATTVYLLVRAISQ